MDHRQGSKDIGHCNAIYIDKKKVSWSFYIGEKNISPGSGVRMLVFFLKKLFFEEGLSKIEAKIILNNHKSKKIHQEFGFILKSTSENFENYIDPKDPAINCLDVAIITAPEKRTKKTIKKLKTVAGRVLLK